MEVFVADDCSTDDTPQIVGEFDCKFISTETNTGGPNRGRNLALKQATGDAICIVDHDDIWKQDKLVTQLPCLEKAPIVTSAYEIINTQSNKTTDTLRQTDEKETMYAEGATFLAKLTKSLKGQNTYLGTILYSSSLKHILFEEKYGMVDFDWVLQLFHQQKSIELNKITYTRFVDGANLSLNANYRDKDYKHSLQFIQQYEQQFPQEVALARKRINGSRARYFYLIDNMPKAREYFLKSPLNLKTVLYYLTSFYGADWVKERFNVFG